MSPFLNIGSLKKSPIVNRVRNIYRDNSMDSALDSLRMQSINISHIRDLSTGLKSSSSDSSCEETETYQRLEFPYRKRFYERKQIKSRNESIESLNLERNNTFSEYEKRKNYGEDSLNISIDSFETPMSSETEFTIQTKTKENMSPLQFLLNYNGSSTVEKEQKDTKINSDSFESLSSGNQSPVSITNINENLIKNKSNLRFKSEPISGTTFTPTKNNVMDKTYPESSNLSYSFNNTCYVFRIFFEPKLSTVKETTFIPSRIIINKSPFIIGSDTSCDLVLSKRKFKFIAPRHCKITYYTYSNNPVNSPNSLNSPDSVDYQSPSKYQSYLNSLDYMNTNNNTNNNNNEDNNNKHNNTNTNNNNININNKDNEDIEYTQNTEDIQYTQNSPNSLNSYKSPNSPTSTNSIYHSPTNKYINKSDIEKDDITSYRVKIVKSSPSGTTYVNNSLLRGNLFLENGDLISLGPRNNYLTFRVVFRTKKECQLLKNQLSNTNSDIFNSLNSINQTEDELNSKESYNILNKEDYITTTEDERIVLADDLDITGVKIFLFQIFNYSTKSIYSDKSNDIEEVEYNSIDKDYSENKNIENILNDDKINNTNNNDNKHNNTNTNNNNINNKDNEDIEYYSLSCYTNSQGTEISETKQHILYEQFHILNDSQSQQELSQDSDYYKLTSPMRNYHLLNQIKSPSNIKINQELYINNLDSLKLDPLMEVYSSSERILNSFNINGTKQTKENNSSEDIHEDSEEDEEYLDKVNFLKSITPTNFPVVIDTNRSSLSGSTTPTGGKTHYKLIGMVDACNNMNISELLPIIDEQVRNNIDNNLKDFQVILKKSNLPVDREMLDNSWVFQLEFLDIDNPKIKRAILKNEMFKGGKKELERVLKDNKCRVMYIKTD